MSRLGRLFRRRSLERELAGEVEAYVAERADELVEQGMNRDEALSAARRQFGNPVRMLEDSREVWSFMPVENALRDLRIGVRALRHNPMFTIVAAVTLALGIGANTAIFSIIDAVLLKPLPIPDANRVVVLWEHPPKSLTTASKNSLDNQNPASPINFLDWRDRTHSFEDMAAIAWFPKGLSGAGEPREVTGLDVSAAFFRILGTPPFMGRTFTDKEDVPDGPKVVVLSYALWRQQFGADRGILGRTIRLMDEPYTVIGVMPEGFDLPYLHGELWTPVQIDRKSKSLDGRYLNVIAKLKRGVTIAQAESDLSGVARQIARERPFSNRGWGAGVVSLYEQTTGDVRKALLLLFGAVTFVLLIATANVANLLLMRGTQRQREIAVRAALGASRSRIAGQLLAERFLLSIAGGALGVVLAFTGLRAIVASATALSLPRIDGVHLDLRVLAFSALLCLLTTFLFGLAPALTFSRTDPDDALRQGVRATGRGGLRTRRLLVAIEVALSLVLLIGAGLLARSFMNEIGVERGFRTDHILTMRMFFAGPQYEDNGRRARYLQQILDRVRTLPGVEAASSAHFLPMTGIVSGSCYTRADRPEPAPGLQPSSDYLIISPQYFTTMGIPFLAGRDFNAHDTVATEPGIIVNRAFVRREFGNENPIGKRLNLCWNVTHGIIIGVVADARQTDLAVEPHPTIFLDNEQTPMYFGALVVRTALPPTGVARAVEKIIHNVDPDQAVSHIETMDDVLAESVARPRLESVLLSIFAGIALVLASVGLYGVLAYSVTQRTREIGIRMALGADSGQLVRNIIRDGIVLMIPGVVAGAAAALALTRLISSLLYGVKPADPLTFAGVCGVLLAVGLVASWLPARRASAVDPVGSLRWE